MEIGVGSEQGSGGQHVDIRNSGSGNSVHIVPSGEKHEVAAYANCDATTTVTTKINGETSGPSKAVELNEDYRVFSGIVVGTSGGSAVHLTANDGTNCFGWVVYRRIA